MSWNLLTFIWRNLGEILDIIKRSFALAKAYKMENETDKATADKAILSQVKVGIPTVEPTSNPEVIAKRDEWMHRDNIDNIH